MMINRIQLHIFNKLSKDSGLEVDIYIERNSMEFLEMKKTSLMEITEEEGDLWIHKAYLRSLE